MESWRGLNKIKKPRGKYLTACPQIENIHKRPKFSYITSLLTNGNCLPPAKIKNKRIMIKNTCPFDATIQCIIDGYRDWSKCNQYVDEIYNPTFEFVRTVCSTGLTLKIYDVRATIMSNVISPKDGVLDCAMNASSLISRFLMHNVPSFEFTHQCNDCEFRTKHITPVLYVNIIPFYKNGIKGLQEAIDQCCKLNNYTCNRCKSAKVNSMCIVGNHLFIDI